MFKDRKQNYIIRNPSSKAVSSFHSILLDKALTPPPINNHQCVVHTIEKEHLADDKIGD